jgi:hypothetical protein
MNSGHAVRTNGGLGLRIELRRRGDEDDVEARLVVRPQLSADVFPDRTRAIE